MLFQRGLVANWNHCNPPASATEYSYDFHDNYWVCVVYYVLHIVLYVIHQRRWWWLNNPTLIDRMIFSGTSACVITTWLLLPVCMHAYSREVHMGAIMVQWVDLDVKFQSSCETASMHAPNLFYNVWTVQITVLIFSPSVCSIRVFDHNLVHKWMVIRTNSLT